MRRHTIAAVAYKLGVEPEEARGAILIMVKKQIVAKVGKKPMTRGASADVYEFPDGYEERIANVFRGARLTG